MEVSSLSRDIVYVVCVMTAVACSSEPYTWNNCPIHTLQAEFLRDALYRFLPSATLDRVNRVIKRLQAGKFEGTLGRNTGHASSSRWVALWSLSRTKPWHAASSLRPFVNPTSHDMVLMRANYPPAVVYFQFEQDRSPGEWRARRSPSSGFPSTRTGQRRRTSRPGCWKAHELSSIHWR